MKKYSTLFMGVVSKFPIKSSKTGYEYEVEISPYGRDEEKYNKGCIVKLKQKKWIFSTTLLEEVFENNNGCIAIVSILNGDKKTEYRYNMKEMTKLIVDIYEDRNFKLIDSRNQMKKDFEDMEKWNGVI